MVDSSVVRSSAISIDPEPVDGVGARWALGRYTAELDERFPEGFDTNHAAPPESGDFVPPRGVFLLVRAEGAVVGCGALRTDRGGTAEIRRMWISPVLRGRGAGRRLLWALEDHARRYGCHRVRLDTAAELDEARSLYASTGYVEISAYNDNAYAAHWFEKILE